MADYGNSSDAPKSIRFPAEAVSNGAIAQLALPDLLRPTHSCMIAAAATDSTEHHAPSQLKSTHWVKTPVPQTKGGLPKHILVLTHTQMVTPPLDLPHLPGADRSRRSQRRHHHRCPAGISWQRQTSDPSFQSLQAAFRKDVRQVAWQA